MTDPELQPSRTPSVPQPAGRHATGPRAAGEVPAIVPPAPPRLRGSVLVPAQLPPVTPWMTNREGLLARLDELVWREAARLVVLCGLGGAGKTTAALAWLRRHAARWPDGQLYGDLAGRDDRRPAAVRLLPGWLRALGLDGREVPVEAPELTALWRSVTASRRLAVLVDGVATAGQLRGVLPAGPGCVLVATSRITLPALVAAGARLVPVRPLAHDAAVTLLRTITQGGGPTRRSDGDDGAAYEALARLCGQLPQALTACAGYAAAHPHQPLAHLVDALRERRRHLASPANKQMEQKEIDSAMTAALDTAVAALSPPAQRLYAGLGEHPGPNFGASLAAAIAGVDEPAADELLQELYRASLIDPDAAPGRYRMHELVAEHAHALAHTGDEDAERELMQRILGWHLHTAVARDLVIIPERWHLGPAFDSVQPAQHTTAEALEEMAAELPNMIAAIDFARASGFPELAWQIAEALWGLFLYRKQYREWTDAYESGLAAAQACEDPRAAARMRVTLGVAHLDLGRLEEAGEHFQAGLRLDQAAGHRIGAATALDHLAQLDLAYERPADAIDRWTYARAIHRQLGRPRGAALQLRHIGEAHLAAGRPERAIVVLTDALQEFLDLPAGESDPYNAARARTCLAHAYLAARQPSRARQLLEQALETMRERGATYQQASIHLALAKAGDGTPGWVTNHRRTALELLTQLQHPDRHAVAELLGGAHPDPPAPAEPGTRTSDAQPRGCDEGCG